MRSRTLSCVVLFPSIRIRTLSYLLCCSISSIMSEEPNIVLNVASQLSYLLCCSISSIMSEEPNIVVFTVLFYFQYNE